MRTAVIAMASDDLNDIFLHALGSKLSIICCHDGETALKLLGSVRPDVLLIDLSLPRMDGFAVLEAAEEFLPPVILATTDLDNRYIRDSAPAKGIGYLIQRPANIKMVITRLLDMVEQYETGRAREEDQRKFVADILLKLNFQTNLGGFQQLQAAIPLFASDTGQCVCKELYPAVAKTLGSTGQENIEHSIRRSIRTAWSSGDKALWSYYFPPRPGKPDRYPSNKLFISRMAEMLKQGF